MFLGRKNKNGKGFSLTELLVVIFIIALISSLATVSFFQIRKKNRDNKRVNDIHEIQLALESYKFFEGQYPEELIPGGTLIGSTTGNVYLDKVPNNQPYYSYDCPVDEYSYFYNEELENYSIYFCLEGKVENYLAGNKCAVSGSILDLDCSNIAKEGLVLYYNPANPNSYSGVGTTIYDLTENDNNGTLVNDVSYSTNNGGVLVFDGSNDYVNIVDNSIFSFGDGTSDYPFSVSAWIKPSTQIASNQFQGIVAKDNSTHREWALINDKNTQKIRIFIKSALGNNQKSIDTTTNLSVDTWYYIVATYSGSKTVAGLKLYLNGSYETPVNTIDNAYVAMNNGNAPVTIGTYYNYSTSNFKGNISDVHIYNRALSPEEVLQNFNATKSRFGL